MFRKLMNIQTKIKAPKNLYNSFGKYHYRNAEGICEAVKPYLVEENCSLFLTDKIIEVCGRVYVEATATLVDNESEKSISVSASAREAVEKKGMDESQITGTASSYARKYALNGLFLLDDTKDSDVEENQTDAEAEAKAKVEFEQKSAELAKQKISETKIKTIKEKCANDGVSEEFLLSSFKLDCFENMTEKQFAYALEKWENVKKMAKGE